VEKKELLASGGQRVDGHPSAVKGLQARRDAEILRQMKERGSVSPLRGYKRPIPTDITIEKCSGRVYLVTPMSRWGADWLREKFEHKEEKVFFCDGLVLSHEDAWKIIKTRPETMAVALLGYCDDILARENSAAPTNEGQSG
jgi:hypothetical protein